MTSSLYKTVVQLELRARLQSSMAASWERKVWQRRKPYTIHFSRVSKDKYSQGIVSVCAGFSNWLGLETRESI